MSTTRQIQLKCTAQRWFELVFVALLFMVFIGIARPSWAQAAPPICSPAGYSIVFINGIKNSPEEAAVNLRALQALTNETTHNGQPLDYYLTYNPSRGLFSDLADSALEKSIELNIPFPAIISLYLLSNVVEPVISSLPPAIFTDLIQDVAVYYANKLSAAQLLAKASDPDLQSIVLAISGLPANRALLLIGHSQGTLYANLAYQELVKGGRQPSSINVTGAAVVPNQLAGSYTTYVTSSTDLAINLVRSITSAAAFTDPGPTRSDVPFFPEYFDYILLHGFSGIYANPAYQLAEPLRKAVIGGLDSLTIPSGFGDSPACKLVISVDGSHTGWTVFPTIEMSGLRRVNRSTFYLFGTTGNTCLSGERGSPLYSLDVSIPVGVDFFEAPTVSGVPYQNSPGGPNRRPCSSFVATIQVPPPSGVLAPQPRYWANATARIQTFGGTTLDWEYQLRFDSGDPWTSAGKRCDIGVVPGSNTWAPTFSATCTARLVAL